MALTEAEQRELDQLEYEALQAELLNTSGLDPKSNDTAFAEKAMNVLDYERTPISALLAGALGVDKPNEGIEALKLQKPYPTTSEILARANILKDDPYKARTILGAIGDVASSPSTYASLGLVPALKGLKYLSPITTAIEAGEKGLGKGLWKSSFSKMDVGAEKAGKTMVPSDIMMRENVYGPSSRSINKQIQAGQDARMTARDAILDMGIAPGKVPDVNKVLLPMEKRAYELMDSIDPKVVEKGKSMLDEVNQIKVRALGAPEQVIPGMPEKVIPEFFDTDTNILYRKKVIPGTEDVVIPAVKGKELSPWRFQEEKVLARDALTQKDFVEGSKLDKEAAMLKSQGYQKEAERLSRDPEAIARLNEEWGTIESGRKPQESVIHREMQNPAVGANDLASGATLTLGGMNPVWWLARRAGEVGALQGPMTMAGAGLYKMGTKPTSKIIQRTIGRTPWSLMNNQDYSE